MITALYPLYNTRVCARNTPHEAFKDTGKSKGAWIIHWSQTNPAQRDPFCERFCAHLLVCTGRDGRRVGKHGRAALGRDGELRHLEVRVQPHQHRGRQGQGDEVRQRVPVPVLREHRHANHRRHAVVARARAQADGHVAACDDGARARQHPGQHRWSDPKSAARCREVKCKRDKTILFLVVCVPSSMLHGGTSARRAREVFTSGVEQTRGHDGAHLAHGVLVLVLDHLVQLLAERRHPRLRLLDQDHGHGDESTLQHKKTSTQSVQRSSMESPILQIVLITKGSL